VHLQAPYALLAAAAASVMAASWRGDKRAVFSAMVACANHLAMHGASPQIKVSTIAAAMRALGSKHMRTEVRRGLCPSAPGRCWCRGGAQGVRRGRVRPDPEGQVQPGACAGCSQVDALLTH
jgi:hypothetical protein